MNQLINAVQMTGRYGKEVYLEVDIMAIVDIIGTIIYKHTHSNTYMTLYSVRKNLDIQN